MKNTDVCLMISTSIVVRRDIFVQPASRALTKAPLHQQHDDVPLPTGNGRQSSWKLSQSPKHTRYVEKLKRF